MLMCRDLARIASEYIDGELNWPKTVSVKMHLAMCKDCRSFIGNLRASTELMKGHVSQQADDALISRIDQRVAEALAQQKKNGEPE